MFPFFTSRLDHAVTTPSRFLFGTFLPKFQILILLKFLPDVQGGIPNQPYKIPIRNPRLIMTNLIDIKLIMFPIDNNALITQTQLLTNPPHNLHQN